jgi:hypothetical protein
VWIGLKFFEDELKNLAAMAAVVRNRFRNAFNRRVAVVN